jgi:TetR/AcrR family transcriptional regulator, transcriptional repressor of aconitase
MNVSCCCSRRSPTLNRSSSGAWIVTQDPPPQLHEAIRQGLNATREFAFGEEGFALLAPQVWAEALRDPALAEVLREKYGSIHSMFGGLVAAEQRTGRIPADADPVEVAKVLVAVVMGYILQGALIGNVDPDTYADALGALVRQN